ncbi:hypothetical protein ANN_12023 [Periplaneta americana]|uniref:Reverse transcriptase domain-containing protein n=1 Tax=Periplaneta americana TaxID=6978 RepID=A0ABQ8T8K1_PERAM|nr:hypothetical protein ANN_12023 [Periplaneta americana]
MYCSPDIIRNIKSRRLRWPGHVAHMGKSRNAYKVLVGRPEGKRPLGRPRHRWEDNIKMDLREVGYDDRDWINLAQDRDRWRAYVRAAMNLRQDGAPPLFALIVCDYFNSTFPRWWIDRSSPRILAPRSPDLTPLDFFTQSHHAGIQINRNTVLDTLMFADDQVIIAKTEDALQRAIYNLQITASDFNMKISKEKTKVMAFSGENSIPSKIMINNTLIERVNSFNYLGCNLSYITDEDMSNKISTGIINTVFKSSHVQKHTRLKVYKTLARPVLTYGSEAWTIRKADEQRLTTAEMRFMRRTAGCSLLEHRKNVDTLQELKMDPIVNFVQQYRLQWKKHVERMDRTRWPKQILTYVPGGKRKLGRPRKRWHETVTDPVGSNT